MDVLNKQNLYAGADFNKSEIMQALVHNLASAPSSPSFGQMYYDTTMKKFGVYSSGNWIYLSDAWLSSISASGALSVTITNGVATLTFNASAIDHGSLGGLTDDDHTQYAKVDGTRSFSAAVNGVDGSSASSLVTKGYVDTKTAGIASGLHTPVANLAGAKAVPASERADKMLMNIETLGIYRYDAESTATSNDVQVIRPTDIANDATAGRWLRLMAPLSDHNNLDGTQGGSSTERYHLTLAQYNALIGGTDTTLHTHDGRYYTETEIDSKFNTSTGHSHNGTDSKKISYADLNNIPTSFAPSAHATAHRVGGADSNRASALIGDNTSTVYTVTHGLNSAWVVAEVFYASTKKKVLVDWEPNDNNSIKVTFSSNCIPTTNQYKVIIIAVGA